MAAINPGTDMDPVAKLLTAIGPCLVDECLSGIGIIIGIRVLIIGIRVLLFGIRVRVIVTSARTIGIRARLRQVRRKFVGASLLDELLSPFLRFEQPLAAVMATAEEQVAQRTLHAAWSAL